MMDGTTHTDLIDQPLLTENGILGSCESESRVKREVEVCADVNYNPSGEAALQLPAEIESNAKSREENDFTSNINHSEPNSASDDSNGDYDDEELDDLLRRHHANGAESAVDEREDMKGIDQVDDSIIQDSERTNECLQCRKAFTSSYYLAEHIQRRHLNDREHQCPQCDKSYSVRKDLTQHVKHVHGVVRYSCDRCGFSSKYSQALKLHIQEMHLKERPHKCPHCDLCVTRKGNLARHITAAHSQLKPYECTSCDKKFSLRHYRDIHWRSVHCGEKPYACDQCDYLGSRRTHLVKHQRTIHEGLKPYHCPRCDFRTSTSSNIKRHLVAMHGCLMDEVKNIPITRSEPLISSQYLGSVAARVCERVFKQDKFRDSAEADLMDRSSESVNDLASVKSESDLKDVARVIESDSIVKREVEDCADMNYNQCGETSLQHSAEIHSSERLTEDDSVEQNGKQEHSSEQGNTELDDSSNELSDGEEFSDLIQKCYHTSANDVKSNHVNKESVEDNTTMEAEDSVVSLTYTALLNNKGSSELMDEGENSLQDEGLLSESGSQSADISDLERCNKCHHCAKRFFSPYHLKEHMQRKHLNIKEHCCTQCDKSYSVKSDLIQHVKRIHEGKIYTCDACDFTSKYIQALKVHISAVHLEEKPHKCPQCGTSFSRKGDLMQHIRSLHTNEKPFACSECDKKFSRGYYRDLHYRTVHCGVKPYQCDQCDYKCSHKTYLTQHVKNVHKQKGLSSVSYVNDDVADGADWALNPQSEEIEGSPSSN